MLVFGMLDMMYADIAPLERLPRSLGLFTYKVPPDKEKILSVGQWVRVPFRGKILDGIVWRIRTKAQKVLRTILPIAEILPVPPLTASQRTIAEDVALSSAVSLSLALCTMLPERPTRKPEKSHSLESEKKTPTLKIAKNRVEVISRAVHTMNKMSGRNFFVPLGHPAERFAFITALCSQPSKNGQTLICVPTYAVLRQVRHLLERRFSDRVIILDSETPRSVYWERWLSVNDKVNAIVVTTKRGIFAPLINLETVIIDSAGDDSHKQWDQNPRYDARDVLKKIALLHHARRVCIDAAVSVELSVERDMQKVPIEPQPQRRMIVDMIGERQRGYYGVFGEKAIQILWEHPPPSLVFCNRLGYARSTTCKDCGWVFACPKCETPYVLHNNNVYQCHHCQSQATRKTQCPQCHGVRLQPFGTGIERAEQELKKNFPKRNIIRNDSTRAQQEFFHADIIVSTEQIFSQENVPYFSSVIVPSIDTMLQVPEYTSAERAFLLIERCASLCKTDGIVIIQTARKDQCVVRALSHRHADIFYRPEIALRRRLNLPPFMKVMRLLARAPSAHRVEEQSSVLATMLAQQLPQGITVEGPLTPVPETIHGQHRRYFLIRLSKRELLGTLQKVLSRVPSEWLLDSDPIALNS